MKKKLDKKRPISKETLKSLKESINLEWTYNSNGIEGNTLTLRETQVVLEGITVKGAEHTPPDYIKVPELMEKLILNYETWNEYHPIIKAALLHGELVKIIDGNGRTSRLLMNLSLMNGGYNPVIIKKESRLNYYEALDKAHTTLDYTDFIKLVTELEIEILKKYLDII